MLLQVASFPTIVASHVLLHLAGRPLLYVYITIIRWVANQCNKMELLQELYLLIHERISAFPRKLVPALTGSDREFHRGNL